MRARVFKAHPKLADLPQARSERFLALDCASLIAPDGPILLHQVTHRAFDDLTPELLAEIGPTAVLMPLISAEQDALIMIEALALLGFSGTILVLAPPLPNPELVERELRAVGPGLQLMLVSA